MKKILALLSVIALLTALAPVVVLAEDTVVTGDVGDTPTITLISPNNGDVSTAPEVTITGTGFVDGDTTVSLSGTGVTAGAVIFDSATQIRSTFTIAADAAAGTRNVYVTAGGKTSTDVVTFTVNAYITVTAPSPVDLGVMTAGATTTGSSATAGSVDTNAAAWTVTAIDAKATATGYMNTATDGTGTSLAAKFQIGETGSSYTDADIGITYSGSPTTLPFYVSQVVASDAPAGSYSITITFTGSTS